MQLIIYLTSNFFFFSENTAKTINLVLVISLTVNVLNVELLTGSK